MFRKIHTANLASPSILCKLWCPLSRHSPVNKTGRFVTYQADFISDDAASNPSQSSRVTALRSSKRRWVKPWCQNVWSPDGYASPQSPNESTHVAVVTSSANFSVVVDVRWGQPDRDVGETKGQWLICRSHNKDFPVIFPTRTIQNTSEWAAFPAFHRWDPPFKCQTSSYINSACDCVCSQGCSTSQGWYTVRRVPITSLSLTLLL